MRGEVRQGGPEGVMRGFSYSIKPNKYFIKKPNPLLVP
jgi:hypothetical protein